MKTEKNTNKITTEAALAKVKAIMERIDTEKEKIRAEYEEVKSEIARRIDGKPAITLGKFGFSKAADFYMSDEELSRRANALKKALELPYYADAEYRECSLIYFELLVNESLEEYRELDKKKEENRQKLIEYRNGVTTLAAEHREIGGRCQEKILAIGLGKFARGMTDGAIYGNLNDYREHCKKYE